MAFFVLSLKTQTQGYDMDNFDQQKGGTKESIYMYKDFAYKCIVWTQTLLFLILFTFP